MGLRSGVARNPPFPLSGDWQEEAQVGQVGLRIWAPVRSRSTSGAQAVRHRVPVLWCDPRDNPTPQSCLSLTSGP